LRVFYLYDFANPKVLFSSCIQQKIKMGKI
jgi:hypothetical protein